MKISTWIGCLIWICSLPSAVFAARTHISIVHSTHTRHKRSYKMLSRFLTRRGYLVTWNSGTGAIHLIWRQPQEVQFRRGKQSYSLTLPATMNDPWVKARTILTHFEHFIKTAPDVRLVRSVIAKDPYLSTSSPPPRTRSIRKAQKASQKIHTPPPKRPRKRRRQTPPLQPKRAKTGSLLAKAPKRRTPPTRTALPKGSLPPPRRKPPRTPPSRTTPPVRTTPPNRTTPPARTTPRRTIPPEKNRTSPRRITTNKKPEKRRLVGRKVALGGRVVKQIQPKVSSAWEFGAQIAGNGALYISRGVQSQTDTTLSSQPAFPLGGSLGVYLGKRRGWLEGWRLRINASIGTIPGLNQGIDLLWWRGGFMISPPLPRYASRNLDIRLELGVLIDGFRLTREEVEFWRARPGGHLGIALWWKWAEGFGLFADIGVQGFFQPYHIRIQGDLQTTIENWRISAHLGINLDFF